jgi:hypothetical protein
MYPKPISTASQPKPDEEPPVLLLFCPEQGGWHTGVYWEGAWRLHMGLETRLEPTSWALCPPDPPDGDARPVRDSFTRWADLVETLEGPTTPKDANSRP